MSLHKIGVSREQAELLVDLLEANYEAKGGRATAREGMEIAETLRKLFGMRIPESSFCELTPVKSSNIEALGMCDGNLIVKFRNNTFYQYLNVPISVFDSLVSSDSVGSYFNKNIKNNFEFVKISKIKTNEKTVKALKESIKKWDCVAQGITYDKYVECPLCELFSDKGCKGCPVYKYTGRIACVCSPYEAITLDKDKTLQEGIATDPEFWEESLDAVEREIELLIYLLPEEEIKKLENN